MTIPAFAEFFRAANGGQSPFPWQSRLAALLRAGEAPSWVTVPTGLGKTAFIDAWAWALAVQAAQPQRTLPTRLIFTVNRRGIVDAAYDRAATLAALLRSPSSDELAWAADALRTCGHALVEPLQVTRMRGGISWDWRWLRQPDQRVHRRLLRQGRVRHSRASRRQRRDE